MVLEKRRDFHAGAWGLACVAMLLPSLPAGAQTCNGDFEGTPALGGWFTDATPGAWVSATTSAVEGHQPTVAWLHAQETFTWQDYWSGSYQMASLAQGMISGGPITLRPTDTLLRFDALVRTAGEDLAGACSVTAIAYGTESGSWVLTVTADQWTTIEVPLTGLSAPVPAGVMLDVLYQVSLGPPAREGTTDEQVTQSVDLWLDNVTLGPPPAPPVPGDADLNGYVDLPDLIALARNWLNGTQDVPATWGQGNFGGSGDSAWRVDLEDLVILARHWHEGTPPGPGAVPEPASAAVLLAGIGALPRRRSGR